MAISMIKKVFGLGSELVKKDGIIDQLVPDSDLRMKLKDKIIERDYAWQAKVLEADTDIAKGVQKVMIAEQERDKVAPRNFFQYGPRPAILWTLCFGIAYGIIIGPIVFQLTGWPMVNFDWGTILAMGAAASGLGYLRTQEKKAGVAF